MGNDWSFLACSMPGLSNATCLVHAQTVYMPSVGCLLSLHPFSSTVVNLECLLTCLDEQEQVIAFPFSSGEHGQ